MGEAPAARPLTVGTPSDLSGVNELLSSSGFDHEVRSNLFLHLVREEDDYQEHPPTFSPELAARWERSADGLAITFHLREGVLWSDGRTVTADDVRFSWLAQTSPDVGWPYAYVKESIRDVEVLSPLAVRFHFTRDYPTQLLDANEGFVLPSHAWGELPLAEWRDRADWFLEHLVVSGPYTVESWQRQQELVLAANPRYYRRDEGLPAIGRVAFRVLPEEGSRLQQLLAGHLDVVERVPPERADEVESHPDLRIETVWPRQYVFIVWNTRRDPFSDPRVRRALTMAIDREALVETLWGGRARVASSPIPSTVWAHDPQLEPWPHDPSRAGELLAEAGWTDTDGDGVRDRGGRPFSFELSGSAGHQLTRDALVMVQEQLRQVGVEARLRLLDLGALVASNESHEFDASLGGWAIDTSLDVRYAFHSSEIDGGSNYGSYASAEADALMDRLAREGDPAAAIPLLHRLQQLLHEDQPYTFMWEPQMLVGVHRRVAEARPSALLTFYDLQRWRLSQE